MNTYFNIKFRISKTETGNDRFTKQEILKAMMKGEAELTRDILCRRMDGKVFGQFEFD